MMAGIAHTVLMSGTSAELFTYSGVTEIPSMQPIGLAAGENTADQGHYTADQGHYTVDQGHYTVDHRHTRRTRVTHGLSRWEEAAGARRRHGGPGSLTARGIRGLGS